MRIKIEFFTVKAYVFEILVFHSLCENGIRRVFKNFKEVFSEAEAILGETEISAGGIKIMLKIFGLLSAGALVSDICRDNSESALGSACDLFVRVLAAIAAMPVFISVIKVALEYLQNY